MQDIKAALAEFYREQFENPPKIVDIEPIRAGWECEIYFVALERAPEEIVFHVLRIYQGPDAGTKARHEYAVLTCLHQVGYPVPEVYALAVEESPLGRPFILMERVQGVPMWRPLFYGEDSLEKERLLAQFCHLMVTLHTLRWESFQAGIFPERLTLRIMDQALRDIAPFQGVLGPLGFDPLFEWLSAQAMDLEPYPPALIHSDLHPNNVLLRPDGSTVVLDWAHATIADPRFDLGWTLALIGSEVNLSWRDRVLEGYERLWGEPIEGALFFEAFGCLKRLAVFALVMQGYAQDLGLLPDLAVHLRKRLEPTRRLYARLLALTGRRISGLENLLEEKGF